MAIDSDAELKRRIMRSPLGRVRGVGSAHTGVHHWWMQRLTALALLPLTLWFIYSVIALAPASREDMLDWFGRPVTVVLLLSFIIMTFHHMQLGLQVIIEDYVHDDGPKLLAIIGMKAGSFLLALIAIVSVLRLGL